MTDNDWTQEKVGAFFGHMHQWVSHMLALLEIGQDKSTKCFRGSISSRDLAQAKIGLGTDPANRALLPDVLKKVVDEDLLTNLSGLCQTRLIQRRIITDSSLIFCLT